VGFAATYTPPGKACFNTKLGSSRAGILPAGRPALLGSEPHAAYRCVRLEQPKKLTTKKKKRNNHSMAPGPVPAKPAPSSSAIAPTGRSIAAPSWKVSFLRGSDRATRRGPPPRSREPPDTSKMNTNVDIYRTSPPNTLGWPSRGFRIRAIANCFRAGTTLGILRPPGQRRPLPRPGPR